MLLLRKVEKTLRNTFGFISHMVEFKKEHSVRPAILSRPPPVNHIEAGYLVFQIFRASGLPPLDKGSCAAALWKVEKTLRNTFGFISHIPRGSISKIAMLLCCLTVITHSSIAILLMDPRGGHIAIFEFHKPRCKQHLFDCGCWVWCSHCIRSVPFSTMFIHTPDKESYLCVCTS